jgi:hypothetical protein
MNAKPLRMLAIPVLTALVLAACATAKPLVNQWSNPAYTAPSFKRIMVGWRGGESAIRRNFEDEFVARLKAAGVDALPSYRSIPEDRFDETQLKQAAKAAGADAVIFARPIKSEQKAEYRPGYYPYPSFGVFGPHIGATWHGFYGAPSIRQYEVYTSEATLLDVNKNEVVWTGTLRTTEPDNVDAAIKNYVETVIKALREKNILRK